MQFPNMSRLIGNKIEQKLTNTPNILSPITCTKSQVIVKTMSNIIAIKNITEISPLKKNLL